MSAGLNAGAKTRYYEVGRRRMQVLNFHDKVRKNEILSLLRFRGVF